MVKIIKKILVTPFLIVCLPAYVLFGGFAMIASGIIVKLLDWAKIGSENKWKSVGEEK